MSVHLSADELRALDTQRAGVRMRRGEYLRCAALDRLPAVIPECNRQAWIELARAASNLNQIAYRLNLGDLVDINTVREELTEFRARLIGAGNGE